MKLLKEEPILVPDSGVARRLWVKAGSRSLQGTRRDNNEDSQFVSPRMDLFIVADGMGGHAAGEIASRFAVDVLSQELAQVAVEANEKEVEYRVCAALDRANCLILDLADGNPQYHRPGTTVVLALLVNHRLYIAGVGDSRAYLVRGGAIERLTIDDTWPDVMFHMGQISADEARVHSMRNRLLSALGMRDFEAGREEVRALDVYRGDRFLLASDGLTDIVREEELLRIIRDNGNPQAAADLLVQRAVAKGGGDDATCVCCYVGCESDDRSPPRGGGVWRRLASLFGGS